MAESKSTDWQEGVRAALTAVQERATAYAEACGGCFDVVSELGEIEEGLIERAAAPVASGGRLDVGGLVEGLRERAREQERQREACRDGGWPDSAAERCGGQAAAYRQAAMDVECWAKEQEVSDG